MAHHGGHGMSRTVHVREVRRARALEVANESPWSKLATPGAKLAYLDAHFPNGASKQRTRLLAQVAALAVQAALPKSEVAIKVEMILAGNSSGMTFMGSGVPDLY